MRENLQLLYRSEINLKRDFFSGPGVFFIIPCVDVYEKIDMRSQTFEIPPQEVISFLSSSDFSSFSLDSQICALTPCLKQDFILKSKQKIPLLFIKAIQKHFCSKSKNFQGKFVIYSQICDYRYHCSSILATMSKSTKIKGLQKKALLVG